jgi:hypothetical protein
VGRTHGSLERGVGNIKKGEVFGEKKKMQVWERRGRIFRIHSRKGTSEDRFRKSRSSEQVPQNQKEVRGFLGLVNYYQKFIHQYVHMAVLLNELLRKGRSWKWNEKEQKIFEQLKEAL